MASQCMKQIRTVEEFKQFIWTFISETFSAVRVDVVHKQRNVSLSQLVKRSPFGKDIPYEFMVFLRRAFLPRGRSVAVEQACAQISLTVILDGSGVRELSVRIRGMRDENRSGPSSRYRRSKISITDWESLASRRKASISSVLTKWRVRRTFPPFFPSTESICVTGRSGCLEQ